MTYKVTRETSLPNIDWDAIKRKIMKPVNAYKHRKDQIYFDDEHIWFWHDKKRKSVSLTHIKSVKKATLHGFGNMINLIYITPSPIIEDGKPVDLHLVDVAQYPSSPEKLCKILIKKIEECKKESRKSRRIHKFADADNNKAKAEVTPSPETDD